MKLTSGMLPTLALALFSLSGVDAGAQVAEGLTDPNVAPREELRSLPHVSEAVANELLESRPFENAQALNRFLLDRSLTPEQLDEVYARAFIHVDLNTASSEEIQLIPGVGRRMAHEFEEYRPWKSKTQFQKEIGKYVDEKEVARLWRYVVIPGAE